MLKQELLRHNYYLVRKDKSDLEALKREQQHELEVKNKEQVFVNLDQKLEELPCNRSSLDAIKRIESSDSHDKLTRHNRLVRYFI